MKKILSVTLILVTVFLSISCFSVAVYAQSITINDFSSKTNLASWQYGTIREGSYTAYEKNGTWYYKFKRNKDTVNIKVSAFKNAVGNNLSPVNAALTKGITRNDTISTSYAYGYKTRTSSNNKKFSFSTYKTNIAWLDFCSIRDGKNIELECTRKSNVEFSYSTKIAVYYKNIGKLGEQKKVQCKAGDLGSWLEYKTPSTAAEYKSALKRNTAYNKKITPTLSIEVTNPGKNLVYLSTARYEGRGLNSNSNTKTAISDFVDIAYTTGKIVAGTVASKTLSISSLYSLGQKTVKLCQKYSNQKNEKSKSIEFISTDKMRLSNDNQKNGKVHRSLKADFESPIKLQNYNDLFRVKIVLTNNPSTSGTKTVLKAAVKNIKVS